MIYPSEDRVCRERPPWRSNSRNGTESVPYRRIENNIICQTLHSARRSSRRRFREFRANQAMRKGNFVVGAVLEEPMDRTLPSQRPACYALVGLLASEFDPSGLLVFLPAVERAGLSMTMARRLEGPLLPTKHSVTAAGPSRNRTGFPVRRPSHGEADHQRPSWTFLILMRHGRAVKRPQGKNNASRFPVGPSCRKGPNVPRASGQLRVFRQNVAQWSLPAEGTYAPVPSTSAKQKPSRARVSPTRQGISAANIGPPKQNV